MLGIMKPNVTKTKDVVPASSSQSEVLSDCLCHIQKVALQNASDVPKASSSRITKVPENLGIIQGSSSQAKSSSEQLQNIQAGLQYASIPAASSSATAKVPENPGTVSTRGGCWRIFRDGQSTAQDLRFPLGEVPPQSITSQGGNTTSLSFLLQPVWHRGTRRGLAALFLSLLRHLLELWAMEWGDDLPVFRSCHIPLQRPVWCFCSQPIQLQVGGLTWNSPHIANILELECIKNDVGSWEGAG
ncbi:hypothetical protein L208DRAFT_1380589 [Tricholoma matsutake]|nr:hypothetical protein L208DRAFT_1380589 [Tricholoma matsutake 945]